MMQPRMQSTAIYFAMLAIDEAEVAILEAFDAEAYAECVSLTRKILFSKS